MDSRPIPLLFLLTNFDRGGAEKIVTRCAIGLSRRKYAVQVAALQGGSRAVADDLARAGVVAHDLGMIGKGDLRVPVRLARLLQRERVRILFTFMFHPTLLGRLIGWLCGVPIRVSSERTMACERSGRRLVNRWTVGLASHVVAVSDRVAAYAAREFRIPPDRLTTIWNGVDLDHFQPTRCNASARALVVGCTARLHAENDHITLLRAFSTLARRWPDIQLLLVGRGPEEERLKALGEGLGILPRIRFVGEQVDVAPFLQQMDLYVQPSLVAGIPNSVLEAMAVGLPVVATAVGGTPEVVVEGETGLLVPPRDPAALTDAMLKVLADSGLAESFGHAGRARVEAHFGEGRMLHRVEALLDRLVERHLGLSFRPEVGWAPC